MFKYYSNMLPFFKHIAKMTYDEMRSSISLKATLISFKFQIVGFIENLDDPEVFVDLIEGLADNHHLRGITPRLFEVKSIYILHVVI